MRLITLTTLLLAAANFFAAAQIQREAPAEIVERGANHRVWSRPANIVLSNGKVLRRNSGYTELAVGMHYFCANAQFMRGK